ncbi:MAG TPA: aminomethyl-transferring glycine dehydrogenase subunit GcvPA [bacterium]|nr:aminomethyl-transferring glycine dehydrogenase subunit GcvPA [bacterium]
MSAFVQHTDADRRAMLRTIGVSSLEELFADIPESIRAKGGLPIEPGVTEPETLGKLAKLAAKNVSAATHVCFAGGGMYDVAVPAATGAIASRPEFSTSYTPYQAEVSQGTLQAIYEFQTIVARLTALDLSNASMYDGGTALAEAVILASGAREGNRVLVTPHLNPHHREILNTMLEPTGLEIVELGRQGLRTDVAALTADAQRGAVAVVLQQPNFYGALEDMKAAGQALQGTDKPLFIASVDMSSLAMLEPPGAYGADIAVGEAQPLGFPMSFGGPAAGVFAAKAEFLRRMPGRIAGLGKDVHGNRAFTLTFQTREQHIRRSKATSNICTNQSLLALMATVTTALLGETGRRLAAQVSAEKAWSLSRRLAQIPGVEMADPEAAFFREFSIRLPREVSPRAVLRKMRERGFLAGIPLDSLPGGGRGLLIAVTEKRLWSEIDAYVTAFRAALEAERGSVRSSETMTQAAR